MGLDTTHGCWHGSYRSFMIWREALAKAADIPSLDLMEGFYEGMPSVQCLPIRWEALRPDVVHILLQHSDCEGKIDHSDCATLAGRLTELLPSLPLADDSTRNGWIRAATTAFIEGLLLASSRNEDVEFY